MEKLGTAHNGIKVCTSERTCAMYELELLFYPNYWKYLFNLFGVPDKTMNFSSIILRVYPYLFLLCVLNKKNSFLCCSRCLLSILNNNNLSRPKWMRQAKQLHHLYLQELFMLVSLSHNTISLNFTATTPFIFSMLGFLLRRSY